MEATGPDGAKVTYTSPRATDAIDGDVGASCDPASGSTFGLGDTTVNCTVTDKAGNKATGSFKVTVQAVAKDGRKVKETRKYRTCAKNKKKGRKKG